MIQTRTTLPLNYLFYVGDCGNVWSDRWHILGTTVS